VARDELDVELALLAVEEPRTLGPVGNGDRARPRLVLEEREQVAGIAAWGRQLGTVQVLCEPVRGEDLQAGVLGGDEHHHHPRRAALRRIGERGLIAMVAVGDQERALGEPVRNAVVLDPPETVSLHLEVGRPGGLVVRRQALVEKEDRLELSAHRAEEP
jgi:hypothetical protein